MSKKFLGSVFLVLLLELWVLHLLGGNHAQKQDPEFFAETQLLEMPRQLVAEKKQPSKKQILKLHTTQKPGKKLALETNNAIEDGSIASHSHGPIPLLTPTPTIPSRFHEKDLNLHAIVEFQIDTQGHAIPKLRRLTGEKELDVLAIETAWKWRFQPAEKDGHPVASKFLIKMLFEVK